MKAMTLSGQKRSQGPWYEGDIWHSPPPTKRLAIGPPVHPSLIPGYQYLGPNRALGPYNASDYVPAYWTPDVLRLVTDARIEGLAFRHDADITNIIQTNASKEAKTRLIRYADQKLVNRAEAAWNKGDISRAQLEAVKLFMGTMSEIYYRTLG